MEKTGKWKKKSINYKAEKIVEKVSVDYRVKKMQEKEEFIIIKRSQRRASSPTTFCVDW